MEEETESSKLHHGDEEQTLRCHRDKWRQWRRWRTEDVRGSEEVSSKLRIRTFMITVDDLIRAEK